MFLSFRGLALSIRFLSILLTFNVAFFRISLAATLVADYRLEDSLKSSVGSPPDLKIVASDYATFTSADVLGTTHPALTLVARSGAQLNTTGLVTSDQYSIVLLVALDSVSSYERVLDVKNPSDGNGWFLVNGINTGYPSYGAGTHLLEDRKFAQMVFTKDGAMARAYVNGVRDLEFNDTQSRMQIGQDGVINLLREADGNYAPGGRIARVRLYQGALTDTEVAALDTLQPMTAPSTSGATVTADYRFENSLKSSAAGASDLILEGVQSAEFKTDTVNGGKRTVLDVSQTGGLRVNTTGLLNSNRYSLVLLFALNNVSSYEKIFDPKEPTDGNGAFELNGTVGLHPYIFTADPVLTNNTFAQLTYVVDGDFVRIFKDRAKLLEVIDLNHRAWISSDVLRFFRQADGNYAPGGRVARIRLVNGALTDAEVAALVPLADPAGPGSTTPPNPVADYRLNETLKSSVGGAPDLALENKGAAFVSDKVAGQDRIVLQMEPFAGVALNTAGLLDPEHYTVTALLALNNVSSYNRPFDVKTPTEGHGLFILNGTVGIHPHAYTSSAIASNNGYVQLTLVKDGIYERLYNGPTKILDLVDPENYETIQGSLIHFLHSADNNYAPGGRIARIRAFNTVLNDAQVAALQMLTPVTPPASSGAQLVADYKFQNNYDSSIGGAPAIMPTSTDTNRIFFENSTDLGGKTVLRFVQGEGLRLDTKGLVDPQNYSIAVAFELDNTSSYNRVIDSKDPSDGQGWFVINGQAAYLSTPYSTASVIAPNAFVEFVLVAEGTQYRLYVNGHRELAVLDLDQHGGIGQNGIISLFRQSDGNYAPGGRVTRVRVFNGSLSDPEVAALAPAIPRPVPGSDWDAARDLRKNEIPFGPKSSLNPNQTVPEWSYGYRLESELASTKFTLLDGHSQNVAGSDKLAGWIRAGTDGPTVAANIGSDPVVVSFCCGPLVPIQTNEVAAWPGQDGTAAIARWTAPATGDYAVKAYWHKTDTHGGGGCLAALVVNGSVVFSQAFNSPDNVGYTNTVHFAVGDLVDFALGPNGDYSFDGSVFSANITQVGGATVKPGDLVVQSIEAPASLTPGVPANVIYTVVNNGTGTANATWTDAIYLTPNPQGNQGFLLDAFIITNSLAPGATLTLTQQIVLPPNGPNGNLYLVVSTDSGNALVESDENNNAKAATAPVSVAGALTLTLAASSVSEDATTGNISATISRNGDVSSALAVSLQSSDTVRATVPQSVTIPASRASASFFVTFRQDGQLTGPKKVTFTATANGFQQSKTDLTVLDADLPALSLALAPNRLTEGGSSIATLSRQGATTAPLTVNLSGSLARFNFPASVTIPAGQASTTFTIGSVDNTAPSSSQTNLITASATGYINGTGQLIVDDNDVPNLSIILARTVVSEGDGLQATTGTITRDRSSPRDLVINFTSGNPQVAKVPATIVIPAGETSAVFDIAVIDNSVVDTDRQVAIGAMLLEPGTNVKLTEAAPVALRVTDDDGPSLKLVLASEVVAEGASPATMATVSRNGGTTSALTVTLASTDAGHVKLPASILIPAGSALATFQIDTIKDAVTNGNQAVTISASAAGLNGSSRTLVVSDSALPDLVVGSLTIPATVDSDTLFKVGLRIENRGPAPSETNFVQRVYLSNDALLSSDDTLLVENAFAGSVAGNGFFEQTLQGRSPQTPGDYWVIAVTDATEAMAEMAENNNTTVSATALHVRKAYTVTVATDVKTAPANTPVSLHGQATLTASNAPAAFVTVDLAIRVRDTERHIAAITDASGNYSTTFQPLPGEGGIYSIAADYPGVTNSPAQATFTLLGMNIEAIPGELKVGEGTTVTLTNNVDNLADAPLSGLTAILVSASNGIQVTPTLSTATLSANGSVQLRMQISAAAGAGSGTAVVRVKSSDGIVADLNVPLRVELARARLVALPEALEAGMRRGGQTAVQLIVTNAGTLSTGPLTVLIPQVAWMKVSSGTDVPSLAPGASATVSLLLTPAPDLQLGPYTGTIVVKSDTTGVSIPYAFRNLSDALGNFVIEAVDEYTYYAAGSPKVTNAFVTIRDAVTKDLVLTNSTGADGRFVINDLREAYYDIEVSADGHSVFKKTGLLQAGKDNLVTAFLSRQTVRYIFSVVPTEIEDRTKIVITTEFETFVPIPVVTVDPPYFDLSSWNGTTVTQVNVTLSNHGLLAANDVRFALPAPSPEVEFTSLISNIGDLPAQSSLTVPVVIKPGGGSVAAPGKIHALAAGSCYHDASFSFDLVCGPQVNTYNVPLRFDKLPGCPSGPTTVPFLEPWNYGGNGGGGAGGGPGGWDYCPWCVAPGPFSFPPPVVASPPENCDPCLLGVGLVAVCIGLNGPEAAAQAGRCAMAVANCAAGLAEKGVTLGTAFSCKGIANGCDASKPPGPLGMAKCLLKAKACLPPKLGGYGIGSGGSFSSSAAGHLSALSADNDANDSAPPEALPMLRQVERALALLAPFTNFFGSAAWLDNESNGDDWGNWFAAFNVASSAGSPGGEQLTDSEVNQLMALPVPLTALQPDDVRAFITRWNRTVDYYRRGIFMLTQVPAGQSADFIAVDVSAQVGRDAIASNNAAMADGYSDAFTGAVLASQEFVARANSKGGGSCAHVKLEIDQQAVITRDAFNATLQIDNDTDDTLGNVSIELVMHNANGDDTSKTFFVRPPVLQGLTATDGTGQIAPHSSGKASWILIPTSEAAPDGQVTHLVGGTLKYQQGSTLITIPLIAQSINVLPNAALTLKYFHQRNVFADDPFTDEIEPSVPYSLAVMIQNTGKGVAKDVHITSAQPKIVENKKGLLIDFNIIGTDVDGQALSPSLNAAFGDINPGQIKIGRWLLKSSLQGLFTDYSASFENIDGLGDKKVALIQNVEIHEMDHIVQADRTFEDGQPDFLVNDVPDFNDDPDTLHLSNGTIAPVIVVTNATPSGAVSAGQLTITLNANLASGWAYLRVPEPGAGAFRLKEVRRADGSIIALETNVWVTDRTFIGFSQKPIRENILHLLDYNANAAAVAYKLTYEAGPADDAVAPASKVGALAARSAPLIPVTWRGTDNTNGSGIAYYDLYVSINGGPFQPWLKKTTETAALYEGEIGKSYAFYSLATDLAGNAESAHATADASTSVNLVNNAPVLTVAADQNIEEGFQLVLNNSAQDSDTPPNTLTWSLGLGAPAGALIDPATGRVTWQTTEATGPSTNKISIIVRDDGQPSLSATGIVTVVVRELNTAPVPGVITNRTIDELQTLHFQVSATDADLPANTLTFSLVNPPSGATITPSGLFVWRPDRTQGPSTNSIQVRVTDNGTPQSLNASRNFTVVVRDSEGDFDLSFDSLVTRTGGDYSLNLNLNSGLDLTGITALLDVTSERLQNLRIEPLVPELASAALIASPSGGYSLQLQAAPGQVLQGKRSIALLRFDGGASTRSEMVYLETSEITAARASGQAAPKGRGGVGRVVLVGNEPLIAIRPGTQPVLELFGIPSKNYILQQSSTADSKASWPALMNYTATNLVQLLPVSSGSRMNYYRVQEQ